MSKIELLPHNQKLYDEIVQRMNEGYKRIFYSEATGLGKSFIFMRLVQDFFDNKRVLYIVPKISIWENVIHYDEFNELNARIDMRTFTAFNVYDKLQCMFNDYDVVFVDECHHMVSPIQGSNVQQFCNDMIERDKYVFGLTATPKVGEKYVDELFFDVSCYGYDVFEAITNSIFPKISIAVADIDESKVPIGLRARYTVESTKQTVDKIINERSDITHWLAYFGRKKDLLACEQDIKLIFPEFKILKLYSKVGDARRIIKEFEEYGGKVILMSVSMLLEGMHLRHVGGVLLYRNVGVTRTYFQIYGRLCKVKSKTSPVLLDVTNSILKLDDTTEFKSSRVKVIPRKYERREIFDVKSYSYTYIDVSSNFNPISEKEYRGVRWTSPASLARVLKRQKSNLQRYFRMNYDATIEDYIDSVLLDATYDEYVMNGYKGLKSITILDKEYKYNSLDELAGKFSRSPKSLYSDKLDTLVEVVTWENSRGFKPNCVYREVNISCLETVANAIGISEPSLYNYMISENYNVQYCVDLLLDKDKWYRGVMQLDFIRVLSRLTGESRTNIRNTYKGMNSIIKVIDYYSDTYKYLNVGYEYNGVIISAYDTDVNIAEQLGVSSWCYHSTKDMYKLSDEECIDFLVASIKVNPYLERTCRSFTVISNSDMNTVLEMADYGKPWEEICEFINNKYCCNASTTVLKLLCSVKRKTSIKLGTYVRRTKYLLDEYELMQKMVDDGSSWEDITDSINALDCNTRRNVVRSVGSVRQHYSQFRYYKKQIENG